jgi:ubiquinone biosynthesis protein UbiJ
MTTIDDARDLVRARFAGGSVARLSSGIVSCELTGADGVSFHIEFGRDVPVVQEGSAGHADLRVSMPMEHWAPLVSRETSVRQLVRANRLRISGDAALARKLALLLDI